MKTLETRITINASAAKVWNVLTDFKSYPYWNPFVIKLEGDAMEGNQISVNLKMEGSKPQTFQPVVLKSEQRKEFRWKGKLFVSGLFDGEHYFILKAISENKTELIHGENFSGVFVGPIWSLIGEKTKNGFKAMNEALKHRVENHAA
jgi:hypothetical protein